MKITIGFLLLILNLVCFSQNYSEKQIDSLEKEAQEREKSNIALINKPFPNFRYVNDRDTIDNTDIKGKIVFINFWFEACAPCIAEIDALNEMYNALSDKENFEFLSFTFEKQDNIERLRLKYHIPYKVISISKDECYRLNNNNGFPTSMIVDSSGLIKYRTSGGRTEKEKAREFIMNRIYPKILKML